MTPARLRTLVVVVLLVLVALGYAFGTGGSADPELAAPVATTSPRVATSAPSARDPQTGLRWVDLGALPREAQQTVALIDRGGPYPYAKDGVTFGNRERLLPAQRNGYYREYTVPTPGEGDRGARRIVTGGGQYFYTGDHYASFARIRR